MSENYPRRAENYKGLDIWYDPRTEKFYANLCEHVKRDKDIRVVKRWLDHWKM